MSDDVVKCLRCRKVPASRCWFDATQLVASTKIRGFCEPCFQFVQRYDIFKTGRVEIPVRSITFMTPDELDVFLIMER